MPRITPPDRDRTILAAAREAFAARGFAATRVEDIARAVGLSKAAVYLRFESKETLFRALCEKLIEETLPQVFPEDLGDTPAPDLLRLFLPAAMHRIAAGEIAFVPRLVIGEGQNFPELARFWHDKVMARVLGLIERMVTHGIARGEFRAVDAHHVARSITGGVVLTAIWRTVFEPVGAEPLDLDAMAAAHLDVMLGGLMAEAGA